MISAELLVTTHIHESDSNQVAPWEHGRDAGWVAVVLDRDVVDVCRNEDSIGARRRAVGVVGVSG